MRTTGYGYPDSCAERLARDNKNILFLGNSYTYGNDLPGMVRSLASAAGKSATTTMVAPGGQTLSGHVLRLPGTCDTVTHQTKLRDYKQMEVLRIIHCLAQKVLSLIPVSHFFSG